MLIILVLFFATALAYAENTNNESEDGKKNKVEAPATINPLLSTSDQLRQIASECGTDKKLCDKRKRKFISQMNSLKQLCEEEPQDERCSALFKRRKKAGWRAEEFCAEHPRSAHCMKRAQDKRKRERRKRENCKKNPEAKSCMVSLRPVKKEYRNLLEYCQDNPTRRKCRKIEEKKRMRALAESQETNSF